MRKFLLFASLIFAATSLAQNLSYGVVIGMNYYNDQRSNGGPGDVFFDSGNDDFAILNLGGYLEYQFNANMGLKTSVTYNKKEFEKGFSNANLDEMYTLSYVDINPAFKYDFGQEYRRGFYMLLGPKFGVLVGDKVSAPDNPDANTDDFKPVYVNLDLGIGWRIFKFIEIEGKIDYGLTPFYKDEYNGCKIFGGYVSVNVDLERILNK
jgi:hypothetical protein